MSKAMGRSLRGWHLASRLAIREILGELQASSLMFWRRARGKPQASTNGLLLFFLCLILGIWAVATVQSVVDGLARSFREDGQILLGGDVMITRLYQPMEVRDLQDLHEYGTVSQFVTMRAMARHPETAQSILAEIKAIDDAYPLYGNLELAIEEDAEETGGTQAEPGRAQNEAGFIRQSEVFAREEGREEGQYGAALDPLLAERLGLGLGDDLQLGTLNLSIRAFIVSEPDYLSDSGFTLGPRLMLSREALQESGLLQTGSLANYGIKLRFATDIDHASSYQQIVTKFESAGWRVRGTADVSPRTQNLLARMEVYLTLVGLGALLIGAVGMRLALQARLHQKMRTIALMKILGGSSGLIFKIYFLQFILLGSFGILAGLLLGALTPWLFQDLLSRYLPFPFSARLVLSSLFLVTALGYGILLIFSLQPLAWAQKIPASHLMSGRSTQIATAQWVKFVQFLLFLGLVGLILLGVTDYALALGFFFAALLSTLLFRGFIKASLWALGKMPLQGRPLWRLALAQLGHTHSPAAGVILALGIGLTILGVIMLSERHLQGLAEELQEETVPALFLIDIQPHQRTGLEEKIRAAVEHYEIEMVPHLRGRIVEINDQDASLLLQNADESWLLRGDRGVTYSTTAPAEAVIEAGEWWPEDYEGAPQISIYREFADLFAVGIGDSITLNILGRDIRAEITSIRSGSWSSLELNFMFIMSPEPLQSAPHSFVAALSLPEESNFATLMNDISQDYPNITMIHVGEALDRVENLVSKINLAMKVAAIITLLAGILVLAGAVILGQKQRLYALNICKVLGATRRQVFTAYLLEFLTLCTVTALLAGFLAQLGVWALTYFAFEMDWQFYIWPLFWLGLLCLLVCGTAGIMGGWRALGDRSTQILRNR